MKLWSYLIANQNDNSLRIKLLFLLSGEIV